jgi:predicted PolB exonuclease-like 3'-5' exonuclease
MLQNIGLEQILFLDIETVPEVPEFEDLSEKKQKLWEKRSAYFRTADQLPSDVFGRAGIYAEFGKIICISVAMAHPRGADYTVRIKSYFGDDEVVILREFIGLLAKLGPKDVHLCAHNGKEFDFPYLARRILIHGLTLPAILDVAGRKPWEVPFLDTMELWKFGDYKHYTSLDLLAQVFQIPSPKSEMDGSMVCEAYWKEKRLPDIVAYCESDVLTVIQVWRRFRGQPIIPEDRVESATQSG